MVTPERQLAERAAPAATSLDPDVRSLLDHIAAELAEEYICLMDAAAEAETASRTPKGRPLIEGDRR